MAVLGLRFCARAFSSCGKWGPFFIAVRGPFTVVASLVAEHRLQTCRLSNCGSRDQSLRGMWDLPRPGLKPVSPALAGRFSTTAPPGKPPPFLSLLNCYSFFRCQLKWYLCWETFPEIHICSYLGYRTQHNAVAIYLCVCLPNPVNIWWEETGFYSFLYFQCSAWCLLAHSSHKWTDSPFLVYLNSIFNQIT